MNEIILSINGYLWGFPMIAFLFFTHILMTFRSGVIQRKTLVGIRLSVQKPEGATGDISPFSALATSLASTLGTGNIIGVGTAIAMGGAGAVFWCWITGVFGMATQYAECLLAVKYRVKSKIGDFSGGTMYVLEHAVGSRVLGVIYAALAAGSGLLTGAAIQSNAISEMITLSVADKDRSFGFLGMDISLAKLIVGLSVAVLTSLVVFGGIRSISRVCSFFVPFMAACYMLGCFAVLFINSSVLPAALKLIISEAFSLEAVAGGSAGGVMLCACRFGMARGLMSNEAGLGTSAVVSASASTSNPVRQAVVAMTATFWDTVVMCLVTGVVLVSTMLRLPAAAVDGGGMCFEAFSLIPLVGRPLLVFSMITFAFSTVLGWSWIGVSCARYIFGERAQKPYLVMWVAAIFIAPHIALDTVWNLADLCNALLAVPNVYALIMCSREVKNLTHRYVKELDVR